jgi:hypothetical protein
MLLNGDQPNVQIRLASKEAENPFQRLRSLIQGHYKPRLSVPQIRAERLPDAVEFRLFGFLRFGFRRELFNGNFQFSTDA